MEMTLMWDSVTPKMLKIGMEASFVLRKRSSRYLVTGHLNFRS
jgi:hypothetical protein